MRPLASMGASLGAHGCVPWHPWAHPWVSMGAFFGVHGCVPWCPWVHPLASMGAFLGALGCIHWHPWAHPFGAVGGRLGAHGGGQWCPWGRPMVPMGAGLGRTGAGLGAQRRIPWCPWLRAWAALDAGLRAVGPTMGTHGGASGGHGRGPRAPRMNHGGPRGEVIGGVVAPIGRAGAGMADKGRGLASPSCSKGAEGASGLDDEGGGGRAMGMARSALGMLLGRNNTVR